MRRIRSITVGIHPSLFEKMEQTRKMYQDNGIRLSQVQITDILSRKLIVPKKIDLIGGGNVKTNKKR